MALTIKFKTQADREADRLWLTDLTGEYNAETNTGGYGTPNVDLHDICLLAIIQRNASYGVEQLQFIPQPFIYNPSADNDFQTVFEALYINDGWHSMNLVALPVSTNGDVDQQGNTILEGQNFYWTQFAGIFLKGRLNVNIPVENYEEVLEQDDLVTTKCEDFFMSKALVYREEQYIDYRKIRKGVCEPNSVFNEMREITEDVISSDLTFRSGLMVQAQDQAETLIDEKNL
jgi:hypothetical protein